MWGIRGQPRGIGQRNETCHIAIYCNGKIWCRNSRGWRTVIWRLWPQERLDIQTLWLELVGHFWEVLNRLQYVIIPEGTTASTLTLACQLRYCMLTVSSVWAVTPHELLVLPFLEINLFNEHQTKLTWILTLAVHNGRHVACASGFSSLMPPVLGLLCHRVVAANDC